MRLAAIDIGSNSIHMVIAEVDDEGTIDVLDREKDMVKLGAGTFASGRFSNQAISEGLACLERYVSLAEAQGVEDILAVATSATREAENGGAFLDQVRRRTGVGARLISGREEARLIHRAVRHALPLGDTPVLVLDIGGGSTEMVVARGGAILAADSLPLGVQRLLDRTGDPGPLDEDGQEALRAHVRRVAAPMIEAAREAGVERFVGTSGTLENLGIAAHRRAGGARWRSVNGEEIETEALAELTAKLCRSKPPKRRAMDGIDERRADAIHLGGLVAVELLTSLGAPRLTLCDASLREGVLLDATERRGDDLEDLAWSPRRRSVHGLGRRYGVDRARAGHVARLALALFDGLRALHGFEDAERELLEAAALLHGIGRYVHFKSHHKHGRYLIEHSGLRGFTGEEVALVALIVRYQRKARPKSKHRRHRRLAKADRRRVTLLAALLRLAVGLDRRHIGAVPSLGCSVREEGVVITPVGVDAESAEVVSARKRAPVLARALGRPVEIRTSTS